MTKTPMMTHRVAPTKAPQNHWVCPLLARVLATVLLALVAGVGATATAAHAVINETPNDCTSVPVTAIAACPKSTGTTAPSPPPADASPPPADKKTAGQPEGTQFGQDEEPTGWAGPIAKDLGQGVQGLAKELVKTIKKGLFPQFEFSRGYLTLYSIMFGLGQLVAALATMIATVKLAERGVESRLLFRQAMIRLLTFAPVAGLAPLALAYAGQLGQGLAQGFLTMAVDQFTAELDWLIGALGVGLISAIVVPGGGAVMAGLFMFLLASLAGVFLELIISHYLVFLLALFIPILYAASINPKWRGGVTKVTGGLLGAVLAPAALFLVWVVAFSAVPSWNSSGGFFIRAGTIGVGLLLSLAAPVAIGMVLSYVVPAFSGGSYDGAAMGGLVKNAQSKLSSGGRPQGPRSSRSKRASDASDSSGPSQAVEAPSQGGLSGDAVAKGGSRNAAAGQAGITAGGPAAGAAGAGTGAGAAGAGAGAAAGAAAGPVGAAVVAWTGMVKKVQAGAEQVRDRVAGRASADSKTDSSGATSGEGGATGDSPTSDSKPTEDTSPAGESKRSTRNVGDAQDTATDGGEDKPGATAPPQRGREKETGDTAPPVNSRGPKSDPGSGGGATPSRRGSGTATDTAKDVSSGRGGSGLGPSPSGPEFSQSGSDSQPRGSRSEGGRSEGGRSDDRGGV